MNLCTLDGVTLAFLDDAFNAFLDEAVSRANASANLNEVNPRENDSIPTAQQPLNCSQNRQENMTSSASTSTAASSSSTSTEEASVEREVTPRTTLKRKMNALKLPAKKARVGRPKKRGALDHYRFLPKPFVEKSDQEKATRIPFYFTFIMNSHYCL